MVHENITVMIPDGSVEKLRKSAGSPPLADSCRKFRREGVPDGASLGFFNSP